MGWFFFADAGISGPPQRGGRSPPREAVLRERWVLTLPGAPSSKKANPDGLVFFRRCVDFRPAAARRAFAPTRSGGCSPFRARHIQKKPILMGWLFFRRCGDFRPAAARRAFAPTRSGASRAVGAHPSGRAIFKKSQF
jgi:hypothetical protein